MFNIQKAIVILSVILFWTHLTCAQHNGELFIGGQLTVESGAIIHVLGDVHLNTVNGSFKNSGSLGIEGHFYKDAFSQYNNSNSGLLKFQNAQINSNENQILEGDFTGINALFGLEVAKTAGTALVVKNGDIEITNQLVLTSGFVKTNPLVSGVVQENGLHISNDAPDAISGNFSSSFIAGKFSRNFISNSLLLLPTGSDDPDIFGPQPLELDLKNGPSGILEVEFSNTPTTQMNTEAFCDVGTPPDNLGTPDGILDTLKIDCSLGSWNLSSSGGSPLFDVRLLPSQSLLNQCDFIFHFIGANGNILDDCPAQDFTFTGLTNFAIFDIPGIESLDNYFLPIELASLEAIAMEDYIQIRWVMLSEEHSLGIELERSRDGRNFEFLKWFDSNGNSDTPSNYIHDDWQVLKGKPYYYRLKLIDMNGNFEYSDIVSAKINGNEIRTEARIFPNPVFKPKMRINFDAFHLGNMKISLFDNMGRMILSTDKEVSTGFNFIDLPSNLAPGTYHMVLNDDAIIRRTSVVVLE